MRLIYYEPQLEKKSSFADFEQVVFFFFLEFWEPFSWITHSKIDAKTGAKSPEKNRVSSTSPDSQDGFPPELLQFIEAESFFWTKIPNGSAAPWDWIIYL